MLRSCVAAALLFLTQSAWALPKAPSILDYDVKETFPVSVSRIDAWEGFDVVQATFPSRVKSLFPENNIVWTRLLLPRGPGPPAPAPFNLERRSRSLTATGEPPASRVAFQKNG